MRKQALLIFAKNPEAGNVKTRLAATMGNSAALAIYNQLLLHTAAVTVYLPVDKFVFFSPFIPEEDVWDGRFYFKERQHGNDLGERMSNAFAITFDKGYDELVIIGSDCLELNAGIIMNAFAYLNQHDVVIGPAADGGYYLLGMKQMHKGLFENMEWSTATVLADTIIKSDSLGLKHYLLPVLKDIDEEKDLETFNYVKV